MPRSASLRRNLIARLSSLRNGSRSSRQRRLWSCRRSERLSTSRCRRGWCYTHLEPLSLLLSEHDFFHHLRLDGHTGEPVEPKPHVTVELVLCLQARAVSDEQKGTGGRSRTFLRTTTSADSIRMPQLPALSGEDPASAFAQNCGEMERRTESGLVGDHVPRNEDRVRRERLWSFVDVQERSEAVPGTVLRACE